MNKRMWSETIRSVYGFSGRGRLTFSLPLFFLLAIALSGCTSSLNQFFNFSGNASYAKPNLSADAGYQLGKKQLAAGKYGLAIDTFQGALRRNPQSVELLNGIAIAFAKSGRLSLATHYFDHALAIDPQSPVTLNNFGYFHLTNGDPAAALAYTSRAVAAKKNSSDEQDEIALSPTLTAAINGTFAHARAAAKKGEAVATSAGVSRSVSGSDDGMAPRSSTRGMPLATGIAATQSAGPHGKEEVQIAHAQPEIRVSNGAGFDGLATKAARFLSGHGIHVAMISNEKKFNHEYTQIFYNPGLRGYAEKMAAQLPVHAKLVEAKRGTGQVEVILGADAVSASFHPELAASRMESVRNRVVAQVN